MKNFVQNSILVIILTIIILFSYAFLQNKTGSFGLSEFYLFLKNDKNAGKSKEQLPNLKKNAADSDAVNNCKAVWLSYLEFNAYRRSVEKNNEKSFRKFFSQVLARSKACGFNRIIVHVRPFGDALYQSGYFPWAACISGKQGKNPGYDPLKVMVEMAHQENFYIEAWINPYRISSGNNLEELSKDNPAKIWATSANSTRNVLSYEQALYYNPSSEEVQELICNGVKEIAENYDVDGIHMDDYFYPVFSTENVNTSFDALEYQEAVNNKKIEKNITMAEWRRENVNALVSSIYQTIKTVDNTIRFGISPAGNLQNLRSDLENYVDIDTWIKNEGYIDYIMPQIYWGYTNTQAPFNQVLNEWCKLTQNSKVDLYIGLQLYRMGTGDEGQSDYEELQKPSLISKELKELKENNIVQGYCFFSYQYLDTDNSTYSFDSNEFSAKRKNILNKITKKLMDMDGV